MDRNIVQNAREHLYKALLEAQKVPGQQKLEKKIKSAINITEDLIKTIDQPQLTGSNPPVGVQAA